MTFDVVECPNDGPLFASVLTLSKLAKGTVGFMPDAAFRQRAERGTLLLAMSDGSVAGFVLYDLPRDEVRIRQLVTSRDVLHQGVARRLVEELVARHPARRGIVLECRRDFPVSAMWPRLDFAPVEERPGHNRRGLPLTTWFRDFGHPTLFSVQPDESDPPLAALDSNIVIDLADGASTTSERLRSDWIQNGVRFAVTDQVLLEIDEQSDPAVRQQHRRAAASHRRLHSEPARRRDLLEQLRRTVPNPDRFDGDLRHAAAAGAAGARWLVTRDGQFGRACGEIVKSTIDVEVVSPGELLVALDAALRDDTYRPNDLHGSGLSLRGLTTGELDEVARAFVNQGEGETLTHLRRQLDELAAGVPLQRISILVEGDQLLGLLAYNVSNVISVQLCRVHRGKWQSTLARQLVAMARDEGPRTGAKAVRLEDPFCGGWIRHAAAREGYLPAGAWLTAIPVAGMGPRSELQSRVAAAGRALGEEAMPPEAVTIVKTRDADAATEELFHPWRLTGVKIPTFVVSIEPTWAAELFDVELARGMLFPRETALSLQRENVYYRSPRPSGGLRAPGRLLWYVKSGPGNERGLRAISTLREIVVGEPDRLYRRYAHLGVYERTRVRDAARAGQVMALRFSHTALLPNPLSLENYRRVMSDEGVGISLQSPQQVPERVFDRIAMLAM